MPSFAKQRAPFASMMLQAHEVGADVDQVRARFQEQLRSQGASAIPMPLGSVLFLLFDSLGMHDLLALRGTNRELRALASDNHAWTDAFRNLIVNFELGEDDLKVPDYPIRAHGQQRDWASHFPSDDERVELAGLVLARVGSTCVCEHPPTRLTPEGVLEDLFHPSSEAAVDRSSSHERRTVVYKARQLPLRCETCDVDCNSYASFTAHCLLKTHKVLLDPSKRFDPRFENACYRDPRHADDGFDALPTMSKFKAMQRYHATMVDFFTAPLDEEGWDNMAWHAETARATVDIFADNLGLSAREVRAIKRECTAGRAAAVWLADFVLPDFVEDGLVGYALDVVRHGWGALDAHGPASDRELMNCISGLDF